MKTSKLVRVLLYLLFIGGNVAVTVSCNSTNCPLNNTVYSTYGFYAIIDGKEEAVQIQDTLTVKASGTDSILINRLTSQNKIELPISYNAPTDTLCFEFTNTDGLLRRDTIWLDKENYPHYESPECPASMFHVVTCIRHTRNLIDSVLVVNPNLNYNASENFKIYFRSAL